MANRMEDKDSEIKVFIGLALAATATLAFWLGQEKINLSRKSIEQEVMENLVSRNQIARVQNTPAPLYTQNYTPTNKDYRGK